MMDDTEVAERITVERIFSIPRTQWHQGGNVYIGRENRPIGLARSPLANPYTSWRDGDAIGKFRTDLWRDMKASGPMLLELARILDLLALGHPVRLLCYCAPSPCHGDVVRAALLWLLTEEGRACFLSPKE